MTVRLKALELVARPGGWTSGRRSFGSFLTFVSGENGAGKTPMMKAIVYALGHSLKLTEHVREKCGSIRLSLTSDERSVEIDRTTDDEDAKFFAKVADGAQSHAFESEADFSAWLFPMLDIPRRPLAGKQRGTILSKPYATVIAPAFWLDQDKGWHVPYSPLYGKDFAKNQGEEVVRWLLNVPQRNPAVDKKDQLKLERELETVEQLVRAKQGTLSELRSDLSDEGMESLVERKRQVIEQLRTSRTSLQGATSTSQVLTHQAESIAAQIEHGRRRRAALTAERRKIALTVGEIEADQEVLLANENAADLFRSVCSNVNCAFFRQPAASYGRRLLFVKDQLKDLQTAVASIDAEVDRVGRTVSEFEAALQQLDTQRQAASQAAGTDKLVAEVEGLATQLQAISLDLVRHEQLRDEEAKFSRLVVRRQALRDSLDEMIGRGHRKVDDRAAQVRLAFEASVTRWLRTLSTPNLDQVSVNENFELAIKNRRFNYDSPESGSTRTRFVLAYHAALLETSMKHGGRHPRWLICDAPRQQEIKIENLNAWIAGLRELAAEHPFQLVLSGKDVFTTLDAETDELWCPAFMMSEAFPQYLGPERAGAK